MKNLNILKAIVVISIVGFILVLVHKKNQESQVHIIEQSTQPLAIMQDNTPSSVLTPEEIAQVKEAQELILKEAENFKIKDQLTAERAKIVAEYDAKLAAVELELSTIRGNKLGFQLRPRQVESQRQSTKQNVGPMVSVIGREDLEKLGITNFSQQPGVPTP